MPNFKQRILITIPGFLLGSFIFFSCGENKKEETHQKSKDQIAASSNVAALLSDTTVINPLVDSLKVQFFKSVTFRQIDILGELAENWRMHSFAFANEELAQSKKLNYPAGEGDAQCKFGIYYCRKFNFDSANYFLTTAAGFSKKNNLDAVMAQSLSWQAEVLRQSGALNKCIELQDKAIELAGKITDKKRLAFCNISKGEALRVSGKFDEAIECYQKAIKYATEINDLNKIAICYNSMGDSYRAQNNYPKALEYFNHGLEIARKNTNTNQIAFCLSSMGDIYNAQKDFKKALDLYEEAYKIAKDNNLKLQQCNSLSSIGMTYYLMNEGEKALQFLNKTIAIAEEIGNKNKLAFAYCAIADVHDSQNQKGKAEEFYKKSIAVCIESNNVTQLATTYNKYAKLLFILKRYDDAKSLALKGFELGSEAGIPDEIKIAAGALSNIYEFQNNNKEALKMLRLFIKMKDSINNESNIKQLAAVEYQAKEQGLKAEQKAKEEAFQAQQAQKEEELKRQKTIRYAFTVGFALVLILVIVVYKNLRMNQRKNKIITAQKKEVEHQKELVDEKNKEITDSINYAKRLQEAILPPIKLVKQIFPESFVLYLPKDIVAGDFYWMERNGDLTFFAAADSTGHGVPGAMVSVVCSNALNRAVKEFKLTEPGKILDKTRDLVLETFEKSEGDVKDGMDISLLCLDSKTRKITWAGANNPFWYVSNGVLEEIKANKQPIGKMDNPLPFTTHEINYSPGTIFYLLTDGYADQFGGPKGKKFKYKQLEELLLNNSSRSMNDQMQILETAFNEWKAGREQVDDVTLIGIKI